MRTLIIGFMHQVKMLTNGMNFNEKRHNGNWLGNWRFKKIEKQRSNGAKRLKKFIMKVLTILMTGLVYGILPHET